ncbi:hypothetical protein CAPTEDRAFT_194779 [Capitella teleta]|uniref:Apple domain-containing protein n=1 Tax=Capitella teleta TaxID=283909 RepID=R7U187_CAPTE|nr:hypothetical protein CAPTEDRAFT_194779 [Capitella teleta]|eukprot:ELT96950.1 hypothetical protein CAPTEDRAFT_194779 [Capitella teleta]
MHLNDCTGSKPEALHDAPNTKPVLVVLRIEDLIAMYKIKLYELTISTLPYSVSIALRVASERPENNHISHICEGITMSSRNGSTSSTLELRRDPSVSPQQSEYDPQTGTSNDRVTGSHTQTEASGVSPQRLCCLGLFLNVISLGFLVGAVALGVIAVLNGNDACPTLVCPSGYELDNTGRKCEATASASNACDECPTIPCPPGYQLDGLGEGCTATKINRISSTSESSTTKTSTTTTPDYRVAAPSGEFEEYNPQYPGPTYIPEGFAAYPAINVAGGGDQDVAVDGNGCIELCLQDPTCVAFTFAYGGPDPKAAVGVCYLYDDNAKCRTPTHDTIVYHMTKLPICTTGDWSTLDPAAENPS